MVDCSTLFETKSIAEVEDFNLSLSLDLVQAKNQLNTQLQSSYRNILGICDNIQDLYLASKDLDSSFMDLCFNDKEYKLGRIEDPDILELKVASQSTNTPSSGWITATKKTNDILNLSNWALSISYFKTQPNTMNFQRMIEEFNAVGKQHADEHSVLIIRNCKSLEAFLVAESALKLNIEQLVELYMALEKFPCYEFGFDVFKRLMDRLLTDHHKILAHGASPVQEFVKRQEFIDGIRDKILQDIDFQWLKYNEHAKNPKDPEFSPYNQHTINTDINRYVHDLSHYEQGLTTSQRTLLCSCVKNTCAMVTELSKLEGTNSKVSEIKVRWGNLLSKELEHAEESDPKTIDDPSDITTKLIAERDRDRYCKFLKDTLEQLQ